MQLNSLVVCLLVTVAGAQRVVPLTVTKERHTQLQRRGPFSENLFNNRSAMTYYATVEVGTPGQKATLIVDTGSSDVWVLSNTADLCTDPDLQDWSQDGCVDSYDRSKSSTSKLIGRDEFSIQYADSSSAEGDYISDNINVGGVTVKGLQMGLALNSTIDVGIMGVGFAANEAAYTPYPSIMDMMASQGLIGIKAYSLYLVSEAMK